MITNEQCSWNPQTLRESAEANGDICKMCMREKGDDFPESDFDEPDFYETQYESDFDDFPPPEEPPFRIIIRNLRNRQDAD